MRITTGTRTIEVGRSRASAVIVSVTDPIIGRPVAVTLSREKALSLAKDILAELEAGLQDSLRDDLMAVIKRYGLSVEVGFTATGVAIRSQDSRIDAKNVRR